MGNEDKIKRLNELLIDSGLGQIEFSKKVGINQPSLSNMLSGNRTIGEHVINKMIISLGINKDWFLSGEGEKYAQKESPTISVNRELELLREISSLKDKIIALQEENKRLSVKLKDSNRGNEHPDNGSVRSAGALSA